MKLNDKSKRILKKLATENRLPKDAVKRQVKDWIRANLLAQRFVEALQAE
jgi:hypothetical protein